MSNEPDSGAIAGSEADDLEILEWDRIRSFLKAPSAPLAIIEVESPEHGDEVLAELDQVARPQQVHIFRARANEDFRRPLDWLDAQPDDSGLFVITEVQSYTMDDDVAREFWTWTNAQRERWPREHGHVVFLLQPDQIDDLCRYAPMLWDWIPLKFNLIRRTSADHRVSEAGPAFAAFMHRARNEEPQLQAARQRDEVSQALREARFKSLRDQLVRARQKGLPEHLVRRNYAWPLFRELMKDGQRDEARRVLTTELGYEFPTELPAYQAVKAWRELRALVHSIEPGRVRSTERTFAFHMLGAATMTKLWGGIGRSLLLLMLTIVAGACKEYEAAEAWGRRLIALCNELGFDAGEATAWVMLGGIMAERHDHASAEEMYRRALSAYEKLGNGKLAAELLGKMAAAELAQSAPLDQAVPGARKHDVAPQPGVIKRMAQTAFRALGQRIEKRARARWLPRS